MFGLLKRTPRRAAPSVRPVRTVRLGLEALESRYCPSAALSVGVYYGPQTTVTLFGTLSGTSTPAGQGITLSGEVNGSATTDANGNYSITLQASALGQVEASWWVNGVSQASATTNLSVAPPNIDQFNAIQYPGDYWLFTGHVSDYSPNGLTIEFGGLKSLQGVTTNVNSSGNFSYGVQLNGSSNDNGWADAATYDWYGQESNCGMAQVTQPTNSGG
jgi:hypothetical protein